MRIKGRWRVLADGKLLGERHNQVTVTLGAKVAAALINVPITPPFLYIAVGTGTTLETQGNTALEMEVARVLCAASTVTTVYSNDTFKLAGSFNPIVDLAIGEIGIFDAAVAGNLGARGTFRDIDDLPAPRNVVIGQLITLEYYIQVAI